MSQLFGIGNPQITLRWTPQKGRPIPSLVLDNAPKTIVLPHPQDMSLAFVPERLTGQAISQRTVDGRMITRVDGYRMICSLQYNTITAEDGQSIMKLLRWISETYQNQGFGIYLRPHRDVLFETKVMLLNTIDFKPIVKYARQAVNLVFTSVDLLQQFQLPTSIGNGTIPITEYRDFDIVGGA